MAKLYAFCFAFLLGVSISFYQSCGAAPAVRAAVDQIKIPDLPKPPGLAAPLAEQKAYDRSAIIALTLDLQRIDAEEKEEIAAEIQRNCHIAEFIGVGLVAVGFGISFGIPMLSLVGRILGYTGAGLFVAALVASVIHAHIMYVVGAVAVALIAGLALWLRNTHQTAQLLTGFWAKAMDHVPPDLRESVDNATIQAQGKFKAKVDNFLANIPGRGKVK